MGIDPRETTIKQIFVLGELCTPEMLANISCIWNANCTHGLYGAQEVFAVATGYPDGKLYFSETNYIAEILPVEGIDESIGELCLTMLVPGAKPLIRFRTGDLASFQEATGKYHNQSRTIQIMGRVNDIVTINNRKFCPSEIESAILGATEWIYGYKVDIRNEDSGKETLEVSIVADLGNSTVEEVEQRLADFFNISVKLSLVTKLDQRTETGAYISWKHARIRDWRNEHA